MEQYSPHMVPTVGRTLRYPLKLTQKDVYIGFWLRILLSQVWVVGKHDQVGLKGQSLWIINRFRAVIIFV